jgi:hypothetical protein
MRWRQDVVGGGVSVDLVVVCGGGARVDRGGGVCRERQGQTRGVFSVKPRFFGRPPLKPTEINFFYRPTQTDEIFVVLLVFKEVKNYFNL